MKKIVIVLLLLISNALYAVNMKGKFGMGLQFLTSPIVNFDVVHYGITPSISLEPSFGIYKYRSTYEYTVGTQSYKSITSNSLKLLFLISNYTLKGNKTSNLMGKLGFLWRKNTYSISYDETTSTSMSEPTFYGIFLGLLL